MDILKIIDTYAEEKPFHVAIKHNDDQLSFGNLKAFSDKIASFIMSKLPDDKMPIPVYGHKNPLMIAIFIGCVKAGHPYCPIDISVPSNRSMSIINQTGCPFAFATENADDLTSSEYEIIGLDEIKEIVNNDVLENKVSEKNWVKGDDLYYIIFTSGSTGNPKGVQITCNCLNNFIEWGLTLGGVSKNNKVFMNQAPFSFDLSVMDLYLSLASGSTLFCIDKECQGNMKLLFEAFEQSNINIWVSTPSFADMCLSDKKFSDELLPQVEAFLFCGETLTNNTASSLVSRFKNAVVVNTYGPTESTVALTEVIVTDEINQKYNPLPVGATKIGSEIIIVKDGVVVGTAHSDTSEKGEIVIQGDTVSTGYFNNKEITEKAFKNFESDNKWSYFTGDEGYFKDGYLFYSGRIDLQIKLHGYRIELGDIENNLKKIPFIENAAVIPVSKDGKINSLTGFVVSKEKVESEFKKGLEIKQELAKHLPNYMIPKKIKFIDVMPMTNNGKLNRKKLEEM